MASNLERKWRERFVAPHAQDGQQGVQPMNVDEDIVVATTTNASSSSNGHAQQGRSRQFRLTRPSFCVHPRTQPSPGRLFFYLCFAALCIRIDC